MATTKGKTTTKKTTRIAKGKSSTARACNVDPVYIKAFLGQASNEIEENEKYRQAFLKAYMKDKNYRALVVKKVFDHLFD